jgi:hypothetical protein
MVGRRPVSTSTPVKPPRLPRSPSEPGRLRDTSDDQFRTRNSATTSAEMSETSSLHSPSHTTPPQQIYVLSADGSSLFLLDPSKPSGIEEPPPYAPFKLRNEPEQGGFAIDAPDTEIVLERESSSNSISHSNNIAGPSINPIGSTLPRRSQLPTIVLPGSPTRRQRSSTFSGTDSTSSTTHHHRPRYTTAVSQTSLPPAEVSRTSLFTPQYHSRPLPDERTPLLGARALHGQETDGEEWTEVAAWPKRRGLWRAIFCGELEEVESERGTSWKAAWRRFWRPVIQGHYWKAMLHLWLLNFPFVSSRQSVNGHVKRLLTF